MNELQPLISVCIANYNGTEMIDACLKSVTDQHGSIPVEIIVHDDASDDGSAEYIRAMYPNVLLIETKVNSGFCVANNRMVAKASGKYILLLNNDAALYPDALKTLLAEAERLNQPAILTLPQYDAATEFLVDRGCLLDPFYNPVPNLDPNRTDVAMVIGACFWIPKKLWNELEGFPEWFGSIAEDMYLCCRARLIGYPVHALSVSGYSHWQGKSFGGNRINHNRLKSTFIRRGLSERNKTFVMIVSMPPPAIYILLPTHLFLLLIEGILLSLLKFDSGFLRRIYLPIFSGFIFEWARLKVVRSIAMKGRLRGGRFFSTFDCCPYKLKMLLRHGLPTIT